MMISRRTGLPMGCSAPICADRGCKGCGDGLGLHIGTVGRGLVHLEILGLFPRRLRVVERYVWEGDTALDPKATHADMERYGFRVTHRDYWQWDTHIWTWDGSRITVHCPRVDIDWLRDRCAQPGIPVVRAEREAA